MNFYEQLVEETQMRFSPFFGSFEGSQVKLSEQTNESYEEQIQRFARQVRKAEVVIVGAGSGLSAAGGRDFYYENNASYRKYFGKFADK